MGEDAVRRLGLERDSWVASAVRGIAGIEERPNALPRSLRLGRAALRRRTLAEDNSVTVGPLPVREIAGRPVAGLLGRDFLSPFDLDLDLPHHRLTLYDVHDCDTGFLPWMEPYASIPAARPRCCTDRDGDGGRSTATGVETVVRAPALSPAPGMFRLGLTPALLTHDPVGSGRGIGPEPVPMYRHRLLQIRIHYAVTRNPVLWVAPVRVVPIVDLLLGADWLEPRRVWLSFATKQIFVAGAHTEAKTGRGP